MKKRTVLVLSLVSMQYIIGSGTGGGGTGGGGKPPLLSYADAQQTSSVARAALCVMLGIRPYYGRKQSSLQPVRQSQIRVR